MARELEPVDRYKLQNDIIDLYLRGQSPPAIAKQVKITINEVRGHIAEFQKVNNSDEQLREQSRSRLTEYDHQTNDVIKEIWSTISDADAAGELKTKATLLKSLSDIQAKRVEVLQKAGLLSDNQIVEDMAVQEEKMQILMNILREVTGKCNHCKVEVARRLSQVAGKAEPIPTVDEEGNVV